MTVTELIEDLRKLPQGSEVVVSLGLGYGLQAARAAVPLTVELRGAPMEYRAAVSDTGGKDEQKAAVHIVGRF